MLDSKEFDRRTQKFTETMNACASWKHLFYGSVYSTRLKEALKIARKACDDLEQLLRDDHD